MKDHSICGRIMGFCHGQHEYGPARLRQSRIVVAARSSIEQRSSYDITGVDGG
jgi:hypothetical protein